MGAGCVDGTKMVLKNRAGVNRKQFLIADGKTIYAFPARGQKYPTCQSFTDKSSAIKCKAVVGLSSVSLSGSKRRNVKYVILIISSLKFFVTQILTICTLQLLFKIR